MDSVILLDIFHQKIRSFYNAFQLKTTFSRHTSICIVTAFDESHYLSGIQLFESLCKYGYGDNLILYDLGLSEMQTNLISERFPFIQIRSFPFDKYPAFFDIKVNAGQYAWKPIILSHLNQKDVDHIIWLDAGNKLVGDLSNINKLIDKFGFFAVPTSNSIRELTHKSSIDILGIDVTLCDQLQLSAAFIGICTKNQHAQQLLVDWSSHSMDERIIAPVGSNRSNHRQDQSVFNLVIIKNSYLRGSAKRIISRRFLVKHHHILTHQDID